MKNLILSIITTVFTLIAYAQVDSKITIGTIDSVQSKILKEQRKIWVYVPNSYQPESKQQYPVVYLLDCDEHFYSFVGMVKQLGQLGGNPVFPEMIVVGILNTDRTRDLTPTHIKSDPPFMDSISSKNSGGGEQFASFMEKELIPYIDATYPTRPYKTLIGHSFGGLTVMNILTNHTQLFNSYICIDPSMWWDKTNFLKTTKKILTDKNFSGTTLYLGIANTMPDGMDVSKVEKDTSDGTKQIRTILDLNKTLQNQKQNGLRFESKFYTNEDHGSVPFITNYDGLLFIFNKFRFKVSINDFIDSTTDFADKLQQHYEEISKMFGYKVLPPENTVNGFGFTFLHQLKHYNKAEKLFQLNVKNYPESINVYHAYSDYFVTIGNKQNAIETLQKALSIKENSETRKKLDALMK